MEEFDSLILAIKEAVVNKLFENAQVLIKLPNGNIVPGSIIEKKEEKKSESFVGKMKNWFKK